MDLHGPAGLRGKTLDHRQPKAGTTPDFLGREERFEGTGEGRLVHATAGIADRDDDAFARRQLRRCVSIETAVPQTDAQDTALGHSIAGINSQVQDRDLELVRVDASRCKIDVCVDHDPNPVTQGAMQQVFDTADQAIEIDRSRIEPLLARKGKQALGQSGSTLGSPQGVLK